jgi:hypothetical protein
VIRPRVPAGLARRIDWSSDAGYAGGGEVIPLGVLIFVMGTLMVTNLWAAIDTKMATNGAAREAARVVAESDGGGSEVGKDAAKAALTTQGRDPAELDGPNGYVIDYEPGGAWAPCARATVTVRYPLALINIPIVGAVTGKVVNITSTHSEIVDPYRSRPDDPGALAC